MRIQLKGRGSATADEELLSRLEKKLEKVARQVSPWRSARSSCARNAASRWPTGR